MVNSEDFKFCLNGVGCKLLVYSDKLVISRKGFVSWLVHGLKGDKTIFFKEISSIQIKLGNSFFKGFLQFSIPGGNESTTGISDAVKDENSILFNKKHNKVAVEVKNFIEKTILTKDNNNNIIGADEILKYKNLLDQGVISQEEFNKKKRNILEN